MNIAKVFTAQISGLVMERITVEIDISNGLHSFSIVGLGDRSVEEAKDRVSAAIKNTGYISPKQKNQKVVMSLAPAHIRKEGTSFDLAMAIAYLKGSGDIDFEYEHTLFMGELSLEGNVSKVDGILPILVQASRLGFTIAFVPKDNAKEACLARNIIVYAVSSLREVIDHLSRKNKLEPIKPFANLPIIDFDAIHPFDISLIKGNETAKRALEIAASGCHNVILYGPPGTGKTMLAKSFTSIIPRLNYEQSIEVTSIHSIAHTLSENLIDTAPFRAPHHTASPISILGGGNHMHPGEITLAHRGVLFLDEFPEFDREIIEALRQPLEDRVITIARAKGSVTFPAQCIFIASMNPCKCGKGKDNGCICSNRDIVNYKHRISSAVLDRIDMWIQVNKVDYEKLSDIGTVKNSGLNNTNTETSRTIRTRVSDTRKIQEDRFSKKIYFNSEMSVKDIEDHAQIEESAMNILKSSSISLGLSGRAFHRIIKVARTIADMDRSKRITKQHILEALQYRQRM